MTSLRQRMLEDMRVRRLSPFTQRTYVETVARFARYFNRSPDQLGPEQIRAYQVYLATERGLSTSSLLVAVSALRFLYRVTLQRRWSFDDLIPAPKKPQSLPVVLSQREVVRFLDAVKAAKHRAILTTCYAAGLRISEAISLTVSAVDSERMVLRIAKGKGQKDRYVMLSPNRPPRRRLGVSGHCGFVMTRASTSARCASAAPGVAGAVDLRLRSSCWATRSLSRPSPLAADGRQPACTALADPRQCRLPTMQRP